MVSTPRPVSNRKYSIKQVSHVSTLFVINSHSLSPMKVVNFEIKWNKCSNRNNLFFILQGVSWCKVLQGVDVTCS